MGRSGTQHGARLTGSGRRSPLARRNLRGLSRSVTLAVKTGPRARFPGHPAQWTGPCHLQTVLFEDRLDAEAPVIVTLEQRPRGHLVVCSRRSWVLAGLEAAGHRWSQGRGKCRRLERSHVGVSGRYLSGAMPKTPKGRNSPAQRTCHHLPAIAGESSKSHIMFAGEV